MPKISRGGSAHFGGVNKHGRGLVTELDLPGTSYALDLEFADALPRTLRSRQAELTLAPTEFGADPTGVSLSTAAFLKWRDRVGKVLSGETRGIRAVIPRGKYRLDAEIEFTPLDAGVSNGRLVIQGAGRGNSVLYGEHLTGNVLVFRGGYLDLQGFNVEASAGRTAATGLGEDEGHGILFKPESLVTGNTLAACRVANVHTLNQPQDGFKAWWPELFRFDRCFSVGHGRHAFNLYGTNASTPQGISVAVDNSRAINCGGHGLLATDVGDSTSTNFQALGCGSTTFPVGMKVTGRNWTIINPDVEGKTKYTTAISGGWSLYGLQMVTRCKLIGGFFGQLSFPIWINGGTRNTIWYPYADNTGLTAAARLVQLASASLNDIWVHPISSYGNVSSITDTSQYAANNVFVSGVRQSATTLANLGAVANAINTTNKQRGSRVLPTDATLEYVALGALTTDGWVPSSGGTTITPA